MLALMGRKRGLTKPVLFQWISIGFEAKLEENTNISIFSISFLNEGQNEVNPWSECLSLMCKI